MKKIINVETGEVIERELTSQELAQRETDILTAKLTADEVAAKDAAKQAVLNKLGLTADEVAALLA